MNISANTVKMLEKECWWCGAVNLGHEMPFHEQSELLIDLNGGSENDQFAPVMVSNKGRYIWSESPFRVKVSGGEMRFETSGEILLEEGFENLKGAYLAAMKTHFPFTGQMPDELFLRAPQYNTWIELLTEQTSEKIYAYAQAIIDHGLVPGVLMIDGGWQEDYGTFEFNKGKIPNPKKLIKQLHDMGFKVMLWVSPIVASAGTQYKMLRDRGYLIRNAKGEIAVREWWSGYSAVLDLTNPETVEWLHSQLTYLMEEYGVDGFKFDAGDGYFYADDDQIYTPMPAREHTTAFNEVGERYSFNEFRAAYKYGGRAIVARLHDKYHSWNSFGLNTLIPHTIVQGLSGYAYCCPDMVGGGHAFSFAEDSKMDEELFVRWAQANALMGMMQMSVAPWRVLVQENVQCVIDAVKLHSSFSEFFVSLGRQAAVTGEPIVRCMEYEFPEQGYEKIVDQFMVGSELLVAPVLEKGAVTRWVQFPKGQWVDQNGKVFEGGSRAEVDAPIDVLPWFRKMEN